MEKQNKREELKFLEEYFKFFSKKNGKNVGAFIAFAQPHLVDTGQISKETLDAFEVTYHLKLQLEQKEVQIKVLKDEVEDLKRQINNKSSSGSLYVDDGCGRGTIIPRGGC